MKSLTAVIVDDEQLAIDTLLWQLKEFCPQVHVVATFTHPQKAVDYLKTTAVELCFLDIDMPEMTGFDLLAKWEKPPFSVVFTTAYDEYAIRAFKVSAFDYLLKPIDEEELVETLLHFEQQYHERDVATQLQLLTSVLDAPKNYSDRLALPTQEGIHIVSVADIVRLEAYKNYTTFHLKTQSSIVMSKTLKEAEQLLDPKDFFRVHKTHVIRVAEIIKYQRGQGGFVTMSNQDVVPVSKQKKEELLLLLEVKG